MTGLSDAGLAAGADRDEGLLEKLRAGDEAAFVALVERYSAPLLRLVRTFVPSDAVAEEVVQETWLGVLVGLDGFEGRASVKTWLFRIAVNRARTRGERERRTVPLASLALHEAEQDAPAVGYERFLPSDHDRWPHHWATPPQRWDESPERSLATGEALALVRAAIAELPPMQRVVMTLRDLEEWESAEVCEALELSEVNQRVLLHRARSRVRAALDDYFADDRA